MERGGFEAPAKVGADLPQAEENIRIYGGDVIFNEQREDATYRWNMNDEFKSDINAMWDI